MTGNPETTSGGWGEEQAAPKKSAPRWPWYVGGGCLLAVILAVVVGMFVVREVKQWADPALQLPKLAKALPFDELPPQTHFLFAAHVVVDVYTFQDDRGYAVVFFVASAGQATELRDKLLDPEETGAVFGQGGRRNPERAVVRVQGRELEGVRAMQEGSGDQSGPSIFLDVTPEGQEGVVAFQLVKPRGKEPITDDEVIEWLKPFHVGPDR